MRRFSYANVMSTLALFVAIGGTSFAAAKIDGGDIRDNSLTSADIKNHTILKQDLKHPSQPVRWFLLNSDDDIVEQSGGFTVISQPSSTNQPVTDPNVYVDAGASLRGRGIVATTAMENKVDVDGDGGGDDIGSGDVSVGRCATSTNACLPTGTDNDHTLAVRSRADNDDPKSNKHSAYVIVTP